MIEVFGETVLAECGPGALQPIHRTRECPALEADLALRAPNVAMSKRAAHE